MLRSICLRDLLCEYIKIEKSVNREIRITTGLGRQARGHSAPNLWARKEISKQSQVILELFRRERETRFSSSLELDVRFYSISYFSGVLCCEFARPKLHTQIHVRVIGSFHCIVIIPVW